MSRPVWITPGGNLGTFPELEFYSLPLSVSNPTNTPVTFSFLSGQLPPGLQVIESGILQGVPVVLDPGTKSETRTYRFTIRAACQTPTVVVDRTFSFTVSNINPPQILPTGNSLGTFNDGTQIKVQLYATEANPAATLVWTVKGGELPPGVTLNASGLLSGFIGQAPSRFTAGRLGYNASPTQVQVSFSPGINVSTPINQYFAGNSQPYRVDSQAPITDPQLYEELPYDYSVSLSADKNYTFEVQVFDGAKYDTHTYTVTVLGSSADRLYVPIVTTSVTNLPLAKENSNFFFKFSAVDYYNTTPLYWSSNITSMIPGLAINANTGWLSGHVGAQTQQKQTYTFSVTAANNQPGTSVITATHVSGGFSNTNLVVNSTAGIRAGMLVKSNVFTAGQQVTQVFASNSTVLISAVASATPAGTITFDGTLTSVPLVCSLTVLGDVNNQVIWDSDSSLGSIINGAVSELSVQAHSSLYVDDATTPEKRMVYRLVHGYASDGSAITDRGFQTPELVRLPQGLTLMPSGHIVGRVSFRYFQLDAGGTTIDGGNTTFDNVYTFTVQAKTVDATVSDTRTFTIQVGDLYAEPYENLYIKGLVSLEQRRLLNDVLKDPSEGGLFPNDLIYRLDDPNFGKATEIKVLAIPGLTASYPASYIAAMQKNFQDKGFLLSTIKTARATDPNNNYAIKYEVVYVDIVDPYNLENRAVSLETDLYQGSNRIKNPYYDDRGQVHHIINPTTFNNMESRITQALGYSAQGVIPDWMTSVQEDKTVLGFRHTLVLAYTKPGQAKKIAWRMSDAGLDPIGIRFVADRYVLDNSLSRYFSIGNRAFVPGAETTFNHLPHNAHPAGKTNFDQDGTRFFDRRDPPGHVPPPAPEPWMRNTAYAINSQVEYQNQYYSARTAVDPDSQFRADHWQRMDPLEITGGTYLKFPQLSIFS
jgi:hypothetical protein